MATQEQLMTALRNADAAGDNQAAKRIAAMIKQSGPVEPIEGIPTAEGLPTGQPVPEESGVMDTLTGAADVVLGAGYGAGKEMISGLGGLFMAPSGQGAEAVEAIKGGIPDYPLSRQGQEVIQAISDKYQAAPEVIKSILSDAMNLGPSIAESAFQATEGLPHKARGAVAALAGAVPGAIEGAAGIKGGKVAADQAGRMVTEQAARLPAPEEVGRAAIEATEALPAPSEVTGKALATIQQKTSATKREIHDSIQSKSGDKIGAGYEVTPYGAVKENPFEQAALSQGWDAELIGAMKNATATDRAAMREMTQIRKRGSENLIEKMTNRPAKIAGDSLMARYKVVRDANKKAGVAVAREAKKLKGLEVDSFDLTNNFIDSLQNKLRIKFDDRTGGFDFTDSVIEKNPAARRALTDLVELMGRGGQPDADRLHFMKKYIDDNVTYGKAKEGLAGDTERIMKELRHDINGALRDVSSDYAAANDAYSKTITGLDNFQDVMGAKVNLTGPRASEAVGRNLRKVMSNYGVRENLLDSITEIEGLATEFGGKFDDSILLQAGYAQKLDDMFGAVADTSLRGAGTGALRDAARGDIMGFASHVVSGATKKILRQTDKKAYSSIMELLK